jgi:solute carrier family 39 (zinc transporter), member 1/2/3
MFGVFGIFWLELVAFRVGTARLKALGIGHDTHGHGVAGGSHAAHGPEHYTQPLPAEDSQSVRSVPETKQDLEHNHQHVNTSVLDDPIPQIIGIAILEFGVLLHSVLIGLTLAVDPEFKILFVVIIFHRWSLTLPSSARSDKKFFTEMFEGLGVGTRLGIMMLPPKYNKVPIIGALLYGIATPIGMAAGLGIRSTYNPGSTTASIVSGVMDSLSSGILLYTGLVELLAHEFLFNPAMQKTSNKKITFACCFVTAGAGIMALLGRWA